MTEQIVILGNSAAAIAAVRALRERGGDQAISMVSKEACSAYSPVLTTYYIKGTVTEETLYMCDADFYCERGVACHFGETVVGLDTATQRVALDDGTELPYDKLLIATGASPTRVTGLDPAMEHAIHYLRTIEDARRIREAAERAQHVVILGAGLVSLQTAGALARPGMRVTCVVGSRQVLSKNIDPPCADLLRAHIERSAAIEFLFGTGVSAVAKSNGGYRVSLDSGAELDADLIVAGKGVAPNIDFVDRAQIRVEDGILVDDQMRTSAGNVWAAGDLAQARDRISGEAKVVAHWVNACAQGAVAGASMAGDAPVFAGSLAENITTLFGAAVASIGVARTSDGDGLREVVHIDEPHGVYRKLVLRDDGVMVGATLMRDVEDAGVVRGAIAAGLAPWPSAEAAVRGHVKYAARLKGGFRAG